MMSTAEKFVPEKTPLIILAEGQFGAHASKTALGVIRYGSWLITAVLDSTQVGKTVREVAQLPCDAPIVSTLNEALNLPFKAKALLIGIAPIGGDLPHVYRSVIIEAIKSGLHIISGLHVFLNEDAELVALARQHQVILWDVRQPPVDCVVAKQLPRPKHTKVITMVGTDCSVGKMSAALELHRAMVQQNISSQFVATGQTGMMITGDGIPLDRIIGDFMAGTLEAQIDKTIQAHNPQYVWVEGQGSLIHPAYSGVTMALLHGSAPDEMILCHNPKLKTINQYPNVPLPPLKEFISLYETAAAWIKPAKVIGIALNTSHFDEAEARRFVDIAAQETGLPATDPIRFGVENLLKAVQK